MSADNRAIEYLPISNAVLEKFKVILDRFDVKKKYIKKFKNFNNENDWAAQCYYLSSYTALKGLHREELLETTKALNLSNDADQLQVQVNVLLGMTLKEVVEMYPAIPYEVLDMLYFSPESFIKTVLYQQADYYCYSAEYQNLILSSIINNLYELTSYSLIIHSNPLMLCNDLTFEVEFPYLWKVVVADRIIDLYRMLHDLRNTRFCILEVKVDEKLMQPVELAYIVTDTQLRVLDTNYMKIVYPGLSDVEFEELDERHPQEVLDELCLLFNGNETIFIGYDIGKQLQSLSKMSLDYTEEILELPQYVCLKRGNDKLSCKYLVKGDFSKLLNTYRVSENDILYHLNNLYRENIFSPNDVRCKTVAMYLLLQNMKFSI